jgi:competence protein ComEC
VGAWLLAVSAGSFWVGILLEGLDRSPSTAWAVALLVAGLAAAAALVAAWPRGSGGAIGAAAAAWGLLATSFGLLGAGWSGLREAHVRGSPVTALAGHLVEARGALLTDPSAGLTGWTASLRTDLVAPTVFVAAGAFRLHDPLWLEGRGRPPPLEAGDRVDVSGTLVLPEGSFGDYLLHRGYPAAVQVQQVRLRGPPSSPLLRGAGAVRSALRSSVGRVFAQPEAGLLMGLALGDTSRLDRQVEEDFRATGLSHLTAVSGENVAMFLAPIMGLVTLLRLGRRGRLAVGLGAIGFFVLLTRAEPSVLRAAVMSGLAMLGIFLGRPRSAPAIVGGAVLLLLGINPTLVYSIGFQLSVAATVGMAILAGPLSERLRFLPQGLALAVGTTLGAQAGVTPVILYHFGAVPTVTLPANLLAFAAVGPGMILGLAAAGLGVVSFPAGRLVALLAQVPLRYLEGLADRLARSPLPSITASGGGIAALVFGLASVAVAGWWIRSGRRMGRRGRVVAVAMLPVLVWWHALRAGPPPTLTVTFFDVGQGDSALVRSPGGADILIDGGPEAEEVAGKLAALGVRRIDLMVATHPHADHVAGLPAVLARFPVGLIVDPGCHGDSPFYAEFLRAVRASGVPFRHPRPGVELRVADVELDVLGPLHCYLGTDSDPNNDSMVLRVSDGPASVMFPGDAEQPAQQEILEREPGELPSLVLKVPHHGGATSLEPFIAAIHALVAVVSVGPNHYGHPVPAVLAGLVRDGMRVFRTDRSGDVTVVFRAGGLLIESTGHG